GGPTGGAEHLTRLQRGGDLRVVAVQVARSGRHGHTVVGQAVAVRAEGTVDAVLGAAAGPQRGAGLLRLLPGLRVDTGRGLITEAEAGSPGAAGPGTRPVCAGGGARQGHAVLAQAVDVRREAVLAGRRGGSTARTALR